MAGVVTVDPYELPDDPELRPPNVRAVLRRMREEQMRRTEIAERQRSSDALDDRGEASAPKRARGFERSFPAPRWLGGGESQRGPRNPKG